MIFVTKIINIKCLVIDSEWSIKLAAKEDIWTFRIFKPDIYDKFKNAYRDKWIDDIETPFVVIKTDENFNILKGVILTPLEIEGIDLEELLDSV